MSNSLLITLASLLGILLVILIALATVVIFLLIKKTPRLTEQNKPNAPEHNETQQGPKEELEAYCILHPQTPAASLCAICMESFCEKCTIEQDKLTFCPEHFKIYQKNKWTPLDEVRTSAENAHESEYLYKFKRMQWKEKKVPLIITTHYQIDIDRDIIESQINLLASEEKIHHLKQELANCKFNI